MKEHGKITGLITATMLLIIAAIAIFSIQLGFFSQADTTNQRKNHSEVRATYDSSTQESTSIITEE